MDCPVSSLANSCNRHISRHFLIKSLPWLENVWKLDLTDLFFLAKLNKDDVNCGNTNLNEDMIVSVVIVIFSNHKLTRKQKSGLQQDGFCVIAAVLYQLSDEDPYIESRPIVEYILKFWNFFRRKLQLLKLQLPLRRSYPHLNFDTLLKLHQTLLLQSNIF